MITYSDNVKLDSQYELTFEKHQLKPRSAKPYFHWHHQLEISYVHSGEGEYIVGDNVYTFSAGDIFIFNSLEPHALGVHPPTEVENHVISFDPRFIWSIETNIFDARYLKIFFNQKGNQQNKISCSHPMSQEISKLFLELESEFDKKIPEYELMIKVKLLNMLVCFIRYYGHSSEKDEEYSMRKKATEHMNVVAEYIDKNLTEEIRLEDLARLCHMNASYFSTFFKKYNGIPPSEYIMKKRIQKAVQYLTDEEKNIIEIAGMCGFNNSSNFNKAFKKVTGQKPSDFRK